MRPRALRAMIGSHPPTLRTMPIRWYGPANPADPTYRHFDRIVNLTLHAALFAAINSGLWVVQELRGLWAHLNWLTLGWLLALLVHAGIVVALRPAREPDA
jgi:hypothetical protein